MGFDSIVYTVGWIYVALWVSKSILGLAALPHAVAYYREHHKDPYPALMYYAIMACSVVLLTFIMLLELLYKERLSFFLVYTKEQIVGELTTPHEPV